MRNGYVRKCVWRIVGWKEREDAEEEEEEEKVDDQGEREEDEGIAGGRED